MKVRSLLEFENETAPAAPSSGAVAYLKDGVIEVMDDAGLITKTVAGVESGPNGELIITGGMVLGDATTPPALTANADDLVVTDIETTIVLRLSATGNYDLTGLTPFDDSLAYMVYIANVGTGNISLKDNDGGSIAANRFLLGGNKTLQTDEGVLLFYDPISNRWRGAGILI